MFMKNILKKFLIVFISLAIIFNISLVSNAVDEDSTTVNDEEQTNESDEMNSSDETQKQKNFYYLGSDDVNITNKIRGDVYILTSGKVTIDSTVEGNVFILANEVELIENSEIDYSLYCISDNLTIDGTIASNTYAISQKFYLTEKGNLFRDLFLMADNIDISGDIDRDTNVSFTNIVLSENAYINGDFNYSSEKEMTIPENVIMGQVNYTNITPSSDKDSNNISSTFFSILSYIMFVIVIFIILKWLNSKLINNSDKLIPNIWKYILFSILGLVITPIASIILLMLGLTINLAFLLLALYLIVILLASSVLIINLSNLIAQKIGTEQNTIKNVLCIVILCITYKLLQLIPFIGELVTFAFVIIGLGIILKTTISSNKSETNNI